MSPMTILLIGLKCENSSEKAATSVKQPIAYLGTESKLEDALASRMITEKMVS